MTELAQMFELQQSGTFFGSWGGLALALLGAGLAAVLSGIGSDYYATRNFKKVRPALACCARTPANSVRS